MMCRTRSAKISAPPPGSESTPAAFSRTSVSSTVILYSFAKNAISTMVNAFTCTLG